MVADRGYDSKHLRRALRQRGVRPCIPRIPRRGHWRPTGRPTSVPRADYARRWRVERTFAWLQSFRRLVVRWDRLLTTYRAFCFVALSLTCLRRLLK